MSKEEKKIEMELGLGEKDNTLEYLVARKTVEMKWRKEPVAERGRKKTEREKLTKDGEDAKPKVKIARTTVWGGGEEKAEKRSVREEESRKEEKSGKEGDEKKVEEVKKPEMVVEKVVEKIKENDKIEEKEKNKEEVEEKVEEKAKPIKNALYVVENEKSIQFKYRVLDIKEIMKGSEKWGVEYVTKDEIKKSWDALGRADIVVILRQTAKDDAVLELMAEAKRRGVKVLFDLDDLVFDYRDLSALMSSTKNKNAAYWTGYIWGIRKIAKEVDGFLTTSEFLGDKLKRSFNKPFRVIGKTLDDRQIELLDEEDEKREVDKGEVKEIEEAYEFFDE